MITSDSNLVFSYFHLQNKTCGKLNTPEEYDLVYNPRKEFSHRSGVLVT